MSNASSASPASGTMIGAVQLHLNFAKSLYVKDPDQVKQAVHDLGVGAFRTGLPLNASSAWDLTGEVARATNTRVLLVSQSRLPDNPAKIQKQARKTQRIVKDHLLDVVLAVEGINEPKPALHDRVLTFQQALYDAFKNDPETGYQNYLPDNGYPEAEAARLIGQLPGAYHAAGVPLCSVYELIDGPKVDKKSGHWGLIRRDWTRKPAFAAYQNALAAL